MNTSFRSVFTAALAVLAQAVFVLFAVTFASAQNPQPALDTQPVSQQTTPSITLIVLADRHVQSHLWPVLVSTLTRDAAAESRTWPESSPEAVLTPGNLRIILSAGNIPGPAYPSRIEVELLGRCDSLWDNNASPLPNGPLGWVLGTPGHIAPIIYVDCAQISQLLWPSTRTMTDSLRLRATSEAISHVILHEWIHIVTQSPAHAERGIMQPYLTAPELIAPITANEKLAANEEPARNSTPALK